MKWLAFIVAAVVGFLVAFGWSNSEEIGAEVDRKLDEDFVEQCVARARFPAEFQSKAPQICGCMKREFDRRGFKLTDAFGEDNAEMRTVVQGCARNAM